MQQLRVSLGRKLVDDLVENSVEVLEDVGTPTSCITSHPGFYSNCLEKWTLRLAASNYKRKDHRKYRQSGDENA